MKSTQTYRLLLLFCTLALQIDATAQVTAKQLDAKAIKAMTGCYSVGFKYTETFAPEVDYEKAYDYTSGALEWAELVEATDDKIVIQHILVINDTMLVKHWRQDWIYESSGQYRYDRDFKWVYEPNAASDVKGKWTQNVYQVDDGPRYSGTATWVHVDGISSWSHKADSPLPRREYTKRSDYNVMKRGNRIQILDYGWLHEQDNDKIIRSDTADVLLVQEKGYNTYVKRPDADCAAAVDYWKKHEGMWSDVRSVWDDVYARNQAIEMHKKVDGKKLYEHLFFSSEEWDKQKLAKLIESYIVK